MQVSVEVGKGLERKMTVVVPAEKVDSAVEERLVQASGNLKLNGFRKGKIPFKVVKDKIGRSVRHEVVGEMISRSYFEAIGEEQLNPAGEPHIEPKDIETIGDLEFVATFEVYPEIKLPDFKKVEVTKMGASVEDSDIDEMIETLRQQRQTWAIVAREARVKDMVNISFSGSLDGQEFQGGSGENVNLILGSERMIPGFEAAIEEKVANDKFVVPLTFPSDYQASELAGKDVEFEIVVNSVSEQCLPEVNEEFFKDFGVSSGGLDAFREEIANNMRRELKAASRNKLKTHITEEIVKLVDPEIPVALVVGEIGRLRSQAVERMGKNNNLDPSMLPDELFNEEAIRRVKLGLVLGEVVQVEKLKADPAKVRQAIEDLAATYESPDEVINWYYGNQDQLATVESSVIEDQVFDFIIAEATVTDSEVSYQEIIKPLTRTEASQE
jgi:trigger factor